MWMLQIDTQIRKKSEINKLITEAGKMKNIKKLWNKLRCIAEINRKTIKNLTKKREKVKCLHMYRDQMGKYYIKVFRMEIDESEMTTEIEGGYKHCRSHVKIQFRKRK